MSELRNYMTSAEVSVFSGATLRQLQWWDERALVSPRIIVHRKCYTLEQGERCRRLAQLRRAGASLQQIKRFKLLDKAFVSVVGVRKPTLVGDVMVVPR